MKNIVFLGRPKPYVCVRFFGHPKPVNIMATDAKTILMILLMCTASLAGCIGGDDEEDGRSQTSACSGDKLVIAYEVKEDMDADSLENPQQIVVTTFARNWTWT